MPSSACSPLLFYSLYLHDALPIYFLKVQTKSPHLAENCQSRKLQLAAHLHLTDCFLFHLNYCISETLNYSIDYKFYIVTFHLIILRSEEHTSELQSRGHLVCRLLLAPHSYFTLFTYTTLFRSTF